MTVETTKDYTPGKSGIQRRWIDEIETAGKWQRDWEQQAAEIVKRYDGELTAGASSSFNILHSNTETLRPALFGQTPNPDIRRRTKMPGTADRTASEILERGITYLNDSHPYEERVNAMISDLLLTGRGVMRVRYTPTIVRRREGVQALEDIEGNTRFFTANNNEVEAADVIEGDEGPEIELEEVMFERADLEHVCYRDFRHTPAKRWQDVRWVAFRHLFTHDEFVDAFGKGKAANTSFNIGSEIGRSDSERDLEPDIFKKAEVWEIWDKPSRQILFICPTHIDAPLAEIDDGPEFYNLRDFFPCPEPLRSIITPSGLLPIPEFIIYQDLADELDEITAKIRDIVETIDVRGAYDGAIPMLGDIYNSRVRLLPIDDWRALTDKGGLEGVMDFVPIEAPAKAFVALTQQRQQLLDTIYQTIGISDIARGMSDPRETATAQKLKGNFGLQRLAPRQRSVQRYLRDLMRIQAEIMAEKFEATTITIMTGIQPDEQVMTLLRLDAPRNFAIDIETDSTIAADQAKEAADIQAMLQGLGQFAEASQALPDAARMPLLQSLVRKFKLGRDVELAIEQAAEQPPAPDPEVEKVKADLQLEAAKLQQSATEQEQDFMVKVQELALKAEELGLKKDEAEAKVIQALGTMFGGESNAA